MTDALWNVESHDPIKQTDLADQLKRFQEQRQQRDVLVFCEGATICCLEYSDDQRYTDQALDLLWTVRLFCPDFELYARRQTYRQHGRWQLRIVEKSNATQQNLDFITSRHVMLLGQNKGQAATPQFELAPNRYRRAELRYPVEFQGTCDLIVNEFQPPGGGHSITCWSHLSPGTNNENATSDTVVTKARA